jgi:hypothetical protein
MKRIKTVILISLSVVVVVIAIIVLLSGRPVISLPDIERVTRIEMWQWDGRNDFGEFTVVNRNDIETIMSALSGARRVGFLNRASNDTPLRPDYIAMFLYAIFDGEEVMNRRLFLYTENNNDYIWNSYVGVFRISQENGYAIRQVHAGNITNLYETPE